jgi:hypothetical protein
MKEELVHFNHHLNSKKARVLNKQKMLVWFADVDG